MSAQLADMARVGTLTASEPATEDRLAGLRQSLPPGDAREMVRSSCGAAVAAKEARRLIESS